MKRNVVLAGLALIVLSLFPLGEGYVQEPEAGNIAGVVLDALSGEPLFGVFISFEGWMKVSIVGDTLGRFWMPSIPIGEYDLRARTFGYREKKITHLRVARDLTSMIVFRLEPVEIGKRKVRPRWQRWQENTIVCDSTEFFEHHYKRLLKQNLPLAPKYTSGQELHSIVP